MDRIRAEFKSDSESLGQSEIYSGGSLSSAAGAVPEKQGSPNQSHAHLHIGTPSKGVTVDHNQA